MFTFGRNVLVALLLGFALNGVSAQSYATPKNAPALVHRSFHFPGGVCYTERTAFDPEFTTYAVVRLEFMTMEAIENCLKSLKKVPWRKSSVQLHVPVDSVRWARTANMACTISGVQETPLLYQVRFAAIVLTGRDKELKECMIMVSEVEDLMRRPSYNYSPPPSNPMYPPVPPTAEKPMDGRT